MTKITKAIIARGRQRVQTDNTKIAHIGVILPAGESIQADRTSSRKITPLIIAIVNKIPDIIVSFLNVNQR